jgi:hypothetical protein
VVDNDGNVILFPEQCGNALKNFWHYYEENRKGEVEHHLKKLCANKMSDGKICGIAFGDTKSLDHHCRLASPKPNNEDDSFFSPSSSITTYDYTHFAALFFVNSNIPFSAANVYLADLLQHVCDTAYAAGESAAAKPSFHLYPGNLKKAIAQLDEEVSLRHPTVQPYSVVSLDTDSSTIHHRNFHLSALHPIKSANCVPFIFNIFLNVHSLKEFLLMKESLLLEMERRHLIKGLIVIDGATVQDAGFRKSIKSGDSNNSNEEMDSDAIRAKCLCHVINLCIAAWILFCPRIAWMIEMLRLINPIIGCSAFRFLFLSSPPGIVPTRWYYLQEELVHIIEREDQLRVITKCFNIPFLYLCRSLLFIVEPVVALM